MAKRRAGHTGPKVDRDRRIEYVGTALDQELTANPSFIQDDLACTRRMGWFESLIHDPLERWRIAYWFVSELEPEFGGKNPNVPDMLIQKIARSVYRMSEWHKSRKMKHTQELVVMSAANSSFSPAFKPEVSEPPMHAQKIPGERPDRNHVFVPLLHSAVDAGVATAVIVIGLGSMKFYELIPKVKFTDMLFIIVGFYFVALATDWYLFGNRSIMSKHVLPHWIEPEPPVVPPLPESAKHMQVFARVEESDGHKRTAGIVPTDDMGGLSLHPDRVLRSCKSFFKNNFTFSQPKSDGLSSSAFDKLKNHWLMLKLIEPAPEMGEGRFKLTTHGRAIVKAIAAGNMTVN